MTPSMLKGEQDTSSPCLLPQAKEIKMKTIHSFAFKDLIAFGNSQTHDYNTKCLGTVIVHFTDEKKKRKKKMQDLHKDTQLVMEDGGGFKL